MELYNLPQGKISVAYCDEKLSIGTLELGPNEALDRHSRPVKEQLIQLDGTCVIKLFDGGDVQEVRLEEGESMVIPADQEHIHMNPHGNKSISMWRFDGNIKEITQNIRQSYDPV